MRIVARQGRDMLLVTDDEPVPGSDWPPGDVVAYVLDRQERTLGPAVSLGAILARGYWEPYEAPLGAMLDGVARDPRRLLPQRR